MSEEQLKAFIANVQADSSLQEQPKKKKNSKEELLEEELKVVSGGTDPGLFQSTFASTSANALMDKLSDNEMKGIDGGRVRCPGTVEQIRGHLPIIPDCQKTKY